MAIQLNITDEKGVITRYHQINKIAVLKDRYEVTIRSYVNGKIRQSDDDIMPEKYYSEEIFALERSEDEQICFANCYDKLLATEKFSGGKKI